MSLLQSLRVFRGRGRKTAEIFGEGLFGRGAQGDLAPAGCAFPQSFEGSFCAPLSPWAVRTSPAGNRLCLAHVGILQVRRCLCGVGAPRVALTERRPPAEMGATGGLFQSHSPTRISKRQSPVNGRHLRLIGAGVGRERGLEMRYRERGKKLLEPIPLQRALV